MKRLLPIFIVLLVSLTIACGSDNSDEDNADAGNTASDIGDTGNTADDGDTSNTADSGSTDGTKQWTKQWGTSENENGASVTVDSSDNIFVTGKTREGNLDGNTNAGKTDIFLTKYSADGTKQWTKQWGTAERDNANAVTVDSEDNIYVTGFTEGDLDGNTNAKTGYGDIFLTKYSADGTKQWTKQWGTSDREGADAVAVDNDDNIYVTGFTEGGLDGNTNVGAWDIFLTKYSSDGTKQWTKQWGTSDRERANAVAVDNDDNIYVTGHTQGDLDGNTNAGGDCGVAGPCSDIFLTKYNADGTKQWTKQWGTSEYDTGSAVTVDSNDNLYVTGYTEGALDGATNPGDNCSHPPCADIFLTKYESNGTKQWTKQWGTPENDSGTSIVIDSDDTIYLTGHTRGSLDGNTNAGERDVFLTKYSTKGIKQWTKLWGTPEGENAESVATGSNETIYVTGQTYGDLDGNTNAGETDIFLTKCSSENTGNCGYTGSNDLCPNENFPHHHDGDCWSDKASDTMNHSDAIGYCEDMGGHLPTISELRKLIQNCPATETGGACGVTDNCLSYSECWNDACSDCSWDNGGKYSVFDGLDPSLWSSSVQSDNTDHAWHVDFFNAHVNRYPRNDDGLMVRCVR